MAKIMLVEDDNNLREIYGERLMAEGYEIVSAGDGEEALATAVKEKPDLIIADVMMPKISGFDMLDILRQAPETKNTKVIMMTALSQAEDKARADKLGADKYLVKSQVTLEDVARVVHDMLGDGEETAQPTDNQAASADPSTDPSADSNTPASPATLAPDQPLATPPADTPPQQAATENTTQQPAANAESTAKETATVNNQIDQFAASQPVEEPKHEEPVTMPSDQGQTAAPPAEPAKEDPKTDDDAPSIPTPGQVTSPTDKQPPSPTDISNAL